MRRDYSCLYEFGLVVCVLGRGMRPPRAKLGCSVSLLADMLTFTAPPASLCCSHHRDSGLTDHQKVPEQYQFAQPAHGEWRIRSTQGMHTHACADFQRNAVECGGTTQKYLAGVSKRSKTQIGWCDNALRGKWLKITESDICAEWPTIYIPVIVLSSPKERSTSSR